MKPKILYVDDEHQNLTIFSSLLRTKYEVLTSVTVSGAYDILHEHKDIPIVISDERMPEQRGITFLENVKTINPDCIRVLLTGFADKEVLEYAINKSGISCFIEKPWNETIVHVSLENAMELYNSKQLLKTRNAELQKSNDALTRFTYSASHEMRSPLTNILGIVKVSRLDSDISDLRNYFNLIESSVIHLDGFVKNLIGFYKNAGIELEYHEVDLQKIVDDIVGSFKFIEGSKNITYNVNIDSTHKFVSDSARIKMILANLVTNAIKFQKNDGTPSEINITITVNSTEANIVVSDNGIGIDEEEQKKLFNMFYRSLHPRSGTGIGLFIVKETVEKLGGKIVLSSKKEVGTTFNITLANKIETK
ncbi:MAG: hybrid sensor histidine kinase/response regulator [Bacteroidetes bacterium]|nr:hybrid sensor histidine kinase/response regulator [Bacteroidota bacterium]